MPMIYCGIGVLLAKANGAVEAAVAAEAEALAERAAAGVSTDTGTLGGGIRPQVDGKTATVTTTAETNPGQARAQEVGSIHNPATQYMEHAAIESTQSFPEKMAEASRKAF